MPKYPVEEIIEPLISTFLIDDRMEFKDQLPEEMRFLLKIVMTVRSNIDKALPGNNEDTEKAKKKLMNSLMQFTLEAFRQAAPKLPKNLSSKVDAILNFKANWEKSQQTEPKARPSLRVVPSKVRELPDPAEVGMIINIIKSIWKDCNTGIALSKVNSVRQLPIEVRAKLMFGPFQKYAESKNVTMEEAMDNADTRFVMAKALSDYLNIGIRQAQSFYAHAAKKFRDSENLYGIFQSLPKS